MSATTTRSGPFHPARPEHLRLMIQGQQADSGPLGWIPKEGLERMYDNGHAWIVSNNADLVGFAIGTVSRDRRRYTIAQCWVRPDARMILHGRTLIERIRADLPACEIRLSCREDLPANLFWHSIGFWFLGLKQGGRSRKKMLNVWHAPPKQKAVAGSFPATAFLEALHRNDNQ